MSEGNVTVRVDTSAVANEVARLSTDLDRLGDQFHNDSRLLQREMAEGFTASVTQMRDSLAVTMAQMEAVQQAVNLVQQEVNRGIEAEAQTKLFEQYAAIAEEIDAIATASQRLEERYAKSVQDTHRVTRRYDSLNHTVRKSYQTDIRRLGRYIFEMMETHFQKTVESRISQQHTGFISSVIDSIEQIRQTREQQLAKLLEAVSIQLTEFLTKRQEFAESIESIKVQNLPVTGEVAVPMVVIKCQEANKTTILAGNEVVKSSGRMVQYQLQDSDIFRTLRSDFSNADNYLQWRSMTPEEINIMERNLQQLLEQNYITQEYYQHLIQGFRNQPPMVPVQVRQR
ncbi:hypothetical protein [Limnofasciculus baicalensis]|uniref:Uncharacterized protein n=1 Tax=Limnofasciculus baicalensis BBK-W-15 TaxID=2699891 RepID=A0AAE3GSA0_9CYAN|nr:hypothetical protein [Limnofasciculus baicalensis]MCP2729027.1 hypothetical protein [Limnofasciculus baicalensis BBK-W-15]